jgi:hypothetical protein
VLSSRYIPILLAGLLLNACSSMWPFADKKAEIKSYKPSNSTEYQCDAGKKFYVRLMDNGNTIWLILPEREFGLSRVVGEGVRYSNNISTLILNNDATVLEISPTVRYTGCKAEQVKTSDK